MTQTLGQHVPATPEDCFNLIYQIVPEATKDLIRALQEGLPTDFAIDSLGRAFPPGTPKIFPDTLKNAVIYIDQELKNGGFAFV